jgi:membrane protease YdiL (CAAX protease family)
VHSPPHDDEAGAAAAPIASGPAVGAPADTVVGAADHADRAEDPARAEDGAEIAPAPAVRRANRVASLIEVVLCSGFPTQLVLMLALALAGWQPTRPDGVLSLPFVVVLSFADTALLLVLVALFLRWRQDDPRAIFLGTRSPRREAWLGLALLPATFLSVAGLALALSKVAPWLRNVPDNPLAAMVSSRTDLAVLAVTVVIAGGVREELQRAFVLNRFERDLGGAAVGLVVFSVAFGLGHTIQGWDAAVLTGMLGLLWGATYLWRRSVVAPMVCHALFNLAELLHFGLTGAATPGP